MAKVTGPLFSITAHGNLAGGAMQFRVDRGRAHVYKPQPPKQQNQQPASANQTAQRERFNAVKAIWRGFDQWQRDKWEEQAEKFGTMKGWSLFLAEYLPASVGLDNILTTADEEPITTTEAGLILID